MPATASANNAVTSTKPTSTFNICDILDLNKKKSKDIQEQEIKADPHDQEHDDDEGEEEEDCEKKENLSDFSSSSVDEENEKKRKIRSPASHTNESSQESRKEVSKKSRRNSQNQPQTSSLLSDTLHQYPHLFQNHPAMRPWFSSNGEFQPFSLHFTP